MKKLLARFGLMLVALAGASLLAPKVFGDSIASPYSAKPATTIGSWSDEVWDASGFYKVKDCGSSSMLKKYCYEFTSNPRSPGSLTWYIGGASIPGDVLVTEWRSSGHVHFTSGL